MHLSILHTSKTLTFVTIESIKLSTYPATAWTGLSNVSVMYVAYIGIAPENIEKE